MDKKDLKSSAEKIKDMQSDVMKKIRPAPRRTAPLWFVAGFAGGLATLFFFDSQRGAARRQMLADQLVARTNDVIDMSGKKARHLRNQAAGTVAEHRPDVTEPLADTGTSGPNA
jgi:hypothetical protein